MPDKQQIVGDWELLDQFSHHYRNLLNDFMQKIGLQRSQAKVLCQLFRQDGMSQSELAQELVLHGATVTGILQRMEAAGLICRRRDVVDNRLVRIYLTDLGRNKEDAIANQSNALECLIFAEFNETQHEALRQSLIKIVQTKQVNP